MAIDNQDNKRQRLMEYMISLGDEEADWIEIQDIIGDSGYNRLSLYYKALLLLQDKYIKNLRIGLPKGTSEFREAISKKYYVDKTLLIKELIDSGDKVTLFTRPRRFGKSLNMSMLKTFFEQNESMDTSQYFEKLNIWKSGKKYTELQGQDIVVYMSFKDIKDVTWNDAYEQVKDIIATEYDRYNVLLNSEKLTERERKHFNRVINGEASDIDWKKSLMKLTVYLSKHYNKNVVVIIDEYDVPIIQGYINGFYNEVITFMRIWLSSALKDNDSLKMGVLSGVMQVAKESIFSGMNNLYVSSVIDERYGEYFGFTQKEVQDLLLVCDLKNNKKEVAEWYNGYIFGADRIYNPWSVMYYLAGNGKPDYYWNETGNNALIGKLIDKMSQAQKKLLYELYDGRSVYVNINQNVSFESMLLNTMHVFSFLLMTGYLTYSAVRDNAEGEKEYKLCIPNKEVRKVFGHEILNSIDRSYAGNVLDNVSNALMNRDTESFKENIRQYLRRTISYYDAEAEGFFHGLMLGIVAGLENCYLIKSNREEGLGRYDIMLEPRKAEYPAVVIEIKALAKRDYNKNEQKITEALAKAANDGLHQIKDNEYGIDLISKGYRPYIIGVAFCGKMCEVLGEQL